MGEAKRRGTFEERKTAAVERNAAEAKRREELRLQAIRDKHEAVRNQEPKVALVESGRSFSKEHRLLLASALALALPPMGTSSKTEARRG